jgi:hypothetical protein
LHEAEMAKTVTHVAGLKCYLCSRLLKGRELHIGKQLSFRRALKASSPENSIGSPFSNTLLEV